MSFLNLGSFGEGFVTGFATEANKALKESINRINTRVDKLKDFQVQRAIKDQDKRRAEIEENREALERAYALLGGDANAERAIAYAGGLLKERGSVEAFNQRIDELQAAKDNGFDIMSYFDRASFDAPAGTLDDYAVAAAGAPQTFATDYRIPEGMDTGTGRTLVGTILGKDIDITGRAMQEAGEEIRALYGADVTTLAQLPTITFKAEEFSLRNKTPSERLKYANEKLALPSVQEDAALLEKYTNMRDEQEKAVIATKDEAATLQVIDAQLNRAEKGSDEEKTLLAQRKTVNRNMQLKAVSDQPVKTLELKIEHALADALEESERTGKPLDRTEVEALENELAALTDNIPTVQSEIDEDREDLRRRSAPEYEGADKLTVGSPEYETELAKIEARQVAHDAAKTVDPLNPTKVNVYQAMFIDAIELAETEAIKQFSNEDRNVYQQIKDLAGGDTAFDPAKLQRLRKKGQDDAATGNNSLNERLAIYDRVSAAFNSVKDTVIARSLASYNKTDHAEAWVAAANLGYVAPETTDTSSSSASAQTAAALGAEKAGDEQPTVSTTPTAATIAEGDKLRRTYPDTARGAESLLNVSLAAGVSIEDAISDAKLKGYKNPAFFSVFQIATEEGQDPAIARMAIEDTNIGVDDEEAGQVAEAKRIIEGVTGFDSKEIRAISKELDVSPEKAAELHAKASAEIEQSILDAAETTADSPTKLGQILRKTKDIDQWNRVAVKYMEETGRDMEATKKAFPPPTQNKNRGGLMSRK